MCMLSYYPEGVLPDAERLTNGCDTNRDGYGYAIVTARRELIVRHGMQADEMIDRFAIERALHPSGPAMFHSRWATSGIIGTAMCHPFPVGRDNRTVVAHNGVFFTPAKDSDESDTAIFARAILPQYNIDKPARRLRLERWLSSNKIVVLTVNPARRHTSYLFGEHLGHWVPSEGGREWHSNRDFEDYFPAKDWAKWTEGDWSAYEGQSGLGYPTVIGAHPDDRKARPDREPWPCEICDQSHSVDTLTQICDVCGSCQECGLDAAQDCRCRTGWTAKHEAPVVRTAPLKAITAGTPSD